MMHCSLSIGIAALFLLCPTLSLAGEIEVRSKHEATLMVDGDTRSYYRVLSGGPFGFVLEGPDELSVAVRQDLRAGEKAGEVETEFMVFQDGYRIRRITLKEPDGGMYLTDMEYTPTQKKTIKIKVPAGKHAYRFELVTKGRSLAVSVIKAAEDLDAMMAVALVDEPPEEKPGPEPEIELAAWEDSKGEPAPAPLPPPPVVMTRAKPEPDPVPAGPRRRHLLLGLRVLAAASGVGSPALGGGAHVLWRTGLLADGLGVGLAVDYLPASAEGISTGGEPRRLETQGLAFGLAVRLQSPSLRGLRWQGQVAGGGALLSADTGGRSASAFVPAVGLSLGPSLELGPGALTLEAQTTLFLGGPEDDLGALSAGSLLGGLGVTVGYQLTL